MTTHTDAHADVQSFWAFVIVVAVWLALQMGALLISEFRK